MGTTQHVCVEVTASLGMGMSPLPAGALGIDSSTRAHCSFAQIEHRVLAPDMVAWLLERKRQLRSLLSPRWKS